MGRSIHVHIHGLDAAWNEADHPRADNGEFGSGGSSGSTNKIAAGVEAIKAMSDDERDDTTFHEMPGGYRAYNLYEAQRVAKKPSDKLKRVTSNNTNTLHENYDYIANVDGQHFGVTKQEDPDADEDNEDEEGNMKQFVYSFERLDHPDDKNVKDTDSSNVEDLFVAMRAYKPPEK